jgi:hypothetical protein
VTVGRVSVLAHWVLWAGRLHSHSPPPIAASAARMDGRERAALQSPIILSAPRKFMRSGGRMDPAIRALRVVLGGIPLAATGYRRTASFVYDWMILEQPTVPGRARSIVRVVHRPRRLARPRKKGAVSRTLLDLPASLTSPGNHEVKERGNSAVCDIILSESWGRNRHRQASAGDGQDGCARHHR